HPGAPLRAVFRAGDVEVAVEGSAQLTRATDHALDGARLREQLGRLGTTPFTLAALDVTDLGDGLFAPVSDVNRMRQVAVEQLLLHRDWAEEARWLQRRESIVRAVSDVPVIGDQLTGLRPTTTPVEARLVAEVYLPDDARIAAQAGATEVVLDPFLRHPLPSVSRVRALAQELQADGVVLRLRTPTIVRPEDRSALDKWLPLGLPMLTGHVGLACELAASGSDVIADYAVNCFNQHTAAELFARGVRRLTASVELTLAEMAELVTPWGGAGFDVVIYGRPEGMTIEHCVLSAAFDRQPTTCRDLCVKSHPVVSLDDPAGYTFPLATDTDCRNRLLHSRPIEGSEFIPRLWRAGVTGYRAIFNVPGEPIERLIEAYRGILQSLAAGTDPSVGAPREVVGRAFTRAHFTRAV
ncbi:MAG TPA: DUF3656 domain-containing protein, partial [Gemmatimonadaceae bacterium]